MRNFIRKFIQHTVLGNTTYSGDAKPYMTNKNKPLWEDFDSLIEQAVVHQKASLYSDLNEEMKWALAIAALRENKTEILDAEYDHFNQLVADVLVTQGSFQSLRPQNLFCVMENVLLFFMSTGLIFYSLHRKAIEIPKAPMGTTIAVFSTAMNLFGFIGSLAARSFNF